AVDPDGQDPHPQRDAQTRGRHASARRRHRHALRLHHGTGCPGATRGPLRPDPGARRAAVRRGL
ncbi:MAG: hypothetical protein AVDCRST_MAG69-1739, partial [uncultured Solirubrobacteraceae bacterium]